MVSGSFDDNEKKHGVWEQYYDNWQQKMKGEYSHGKKHNQWKYYTKESKLYKVENYNLGVLTSKWTGDTDDVENRVEHVIDAAKDAVTGMVEEVVDVTENANSEEVEVISDPDAVGSVDVASEVVESKNYYGNRLNGEWKFYNEKGKCIEIGNYKDDQKDGEWKYYYNNEKLKKIQLWKEGKLMEVLSYVDKEGKPFDRGTLKHGSGTVKEYNAESKLISTIEYIYGEKLDWNDSNQLNNSAWNVYENETDSETLQNAIKWIKRSIELDKNYYNTDTYAALLYKTGQYKQALTYAEQAIKIAKKEDSNYDSTTKLIEQIYLKMKQY